MGGCIIKKRSLMASPIAEFCHRRGRGLMGFLNRIQASLTMRIVEEAMDRVLQEVGARQARSAGTGSRKTWEAFFPKTESVATNTCCVTVLSLSNTRCSRWKSGSATCHAFHRTMFESETERSNNVCMVCASR
jgi:hypothetical protein